MISLVDRVKLNYALCTITNIVFYTLILSQLSALSGYFEKLWMHVIYFTFSEILKLVIIQKMYGLDTSYNQEGVKRRRGNKVGESVKFAVLMLLTVISFAFICVIMGGELKNSCSSWNILAIRYFQLHHLRNTKKHSRSRVSWQL